MVAVDKLKLKLSWLYWMATGWT